MSSHLKATVVMLEVQLDEGKPLSGTDFSVMWKEWLSAKRYQHSGFGLGKRGNRCENTVVTVLESDKLLTTVMLWSWREPGLNSSETVSGNTLAFRFFSSQ